MQAISGPERASNNKTRLLTLDQLDGRTAAARNVRDVMDAITRDLGGDPSTAQQQITQRVAVTGAVLEDMAARWMTDGKLDASLWATLANCERRLYETIGIERRARDAKTLAGHVARRHAEAAA